MLNKGTEPTFVTVSQKEVLDVTFATQNMVEEALTKRGVNEPVKRWIMSLLNVRVITYDTFGRKTVVTPTRGSPQGGRVISPFLWTLVIDELLVRLTNENFQVIGYADEVPKCTM